MILALLGLGLVFSIGGLVYACATGDRWPLLFAGTMLVLTLIVGIADLLVGGGGDDGDDDDR